MLTVVIPTHKRNDLLRRTLTSLGKCEPPKDYACTIVVENGGQHGAEDVCKEAAAWLNLKYLYHEQGNKSAALNAVLEVVGDELLVFFDDDVRLESGILSAYAEASLRHENAYFGGPVEVDYEQQPADWVKLPASAKGWPLPTQVVSNEMDEFLGANWAARAEDLRRVGGFDAALGPGGTTGGRGQETDMQLRLRAAGAQGIYVSNALVWHYVPKHRCSTQWSLRRAYQNGVTFGLNHKANAKILFGYPRWAIAEMFRRFAWALGTTLTSRAKQRHLAWHEFHFIRGFIVGQRHAISNGGELELETQVDVTTK